MRRIWRGPCEEQTNMYETANGTGSVSDLSIDHVVS
jgi:hypothetical protein